MIFNKKRVFLYSSILLLILVGIYFTWFVDGIGIVNRNLLSTSVNATGESNITASGVCAFSNVDTRCMAITPIMNQGSANNFSLNWTRGGATELFVFKINISNYATVVGNQNISKINITLPSEFSNAKIYVNLRNATFGNADTDNNWTGYAANATNATLSLVDTTGLYVTFFNWTRGVMGVNSSYETAFLHFNATATNGTEAVVNWTVHVYNSTGGAMLLSGGNAVTIDSGFGLLTGIDGLAPRFGSHNASDGTNTKTSFSGTQYLKYDSTSVQKGVNITFTLTDYNIDRVLIIYNGTGGSLNLTAIRYELYRNVSNIRNPGTNYWFNSTFNGFILERTTGNANANRSEILTKRSSLLDTSAPSYLFSFNISNNTWGEGASDGQLFKYVFVVYDLYNNSEIINNSNAEFVLGKDINNPTSTLTAPSDTTIGVFDPIKYTCDGTDTSGLASCTTTLTKPGSATVTKTGCGAEHTFTGDNTNEAGTYTVECKAIDNVGREATSSSTFSVSAAGGGETGGGGGGGGGGGSAGSSADNPITVTEAGTSVDAGTLSTTETYTSLVKEGTVTFTVAGGSHSAKVLDITEDSVTIEVSSDPQTLTLTTGETKEVDLTDDGTNDLAITLRTITDGKADLVFKSLEVIAPPAEGEAPGVVTGEEAGPGYTWLWVVLVVVVVLVLLWLGRKKR